MRKKTEKELLKIVKNNYEESAEHFSETRKKRIWPELETLAKLVPEKSSILDLGCGNGRLLNAFKQKINYFGIDQSEALIKLAKEMHQDSSFFVGDMLNLNEINFKKQGLPQKFDFIFSIAVLQHIPSKNKRTEALKNLKNYMKADTKLIFSNWNMWKIKKYKKLIWKTYLLKILGKNTLDFGDIIFDWKDKSGKITSQRYYHAFRTKELKEIFRKAGFKIEKQYKDKYNFYTIASLKK